MFIESFSRDAGSKSMNEQHPLVDHENVQPSIKDLLKLVPKHPDVQLFRGPNQIKRAKQLQAAHIG